MLINPVYGYIAAGAALVSFAAGWTINGWRYQSRESKALEQAYAARDEANARANNAAADYEIVRAALDDRTGEVTTKIRTVYRDRKVSADCAIPAGAASLLNDARSSANAAITGKPGSTVPDSPASPTE